MERSIRFMMGLAAATASSWVGGTAAAQAAGGIEGTTASAATCGVRWFAPLCVHVAVPVAYAAGQGVGAQAAEPPVADPPAAGIPSGPDRAGPEADGPFVIPRLETPIRITGRVDDPAWDRVPPLPLVVQHPEFGMPPTERTEIRIAHDGENLYLSCRCYHRDPSGVRAFSHFRDQWLNDDTFSLFLDTFNDRETGVHLYTNPLGTKFDTQVYNDAELTPYGLPRQPEWDTFWDVAAEITDEGWLAEMRGPLSSLQFEETDGVVTMGLIAYRLIWSKNERHIYPAIRPDWSRSYYKPSVARTIVLEGVRSRPAVHATPYALAGRGRSIRPGSPVDEPDWVRSRPAELGLDVRYAFRRPLALDVTVNTDFAVEADDQQLNLDRFSLFVPEKRRFFLERAGLFDFPLGGLDRLFHSRRIGVTGASDVQRILGGGRLVGRVGGWDVGVLSMQTGAAEDAPGGNLGVLRFRRQVLNANSLAGGMVTTCFTESCGRQVSYGVDGILNLRGDDYLTVRWAQLFDDAADASALDRSHLDARLERRRQAGFFYRGAFTRAGPGFDPALGFLERRGHRRVGDVVGYGWFTGGGARPAARGDAPRPRVLAGAGRRARVRRGRTRVGGGLAKRGQRRGARPRPHRRRGPGVQPRRRCRRAGGSVPLCRRAGRLRVTRRPALRLQTRAGAGGFFDGRRVWAEASPSWNLSRHLELSGTYQHNRIRFQGRDQRLVTHLARVRARAALDSRLTGSAFIQYNSVQDALAANVRVRYHARDGTDLWLVYNHGLTADRGLVERSAPATTSRAVVVKYSHTLSF